MNECPRNDRMFPGCKFVAHYDVVPPTGLKGFEASGGAIPVLLEALSTKTFRGTYCTRCGRKGEAA